MVKFNPNIPESESRLLSAPIRQNFNALNDRTDQLSVSNTSPESTSIIIGRGDKVYFQNNTYTPFTGITLDLGNGTSGVEPFSIANRYKKVIVYYKDDGSVAFLEGSEEEIRDLSTTSVAALIATESIALALKGTIPICCVLVTNNGTPSVQGAINPIFESDILDIRPFLQRIADTELIEDHISASSLAEAHPGATIGNVLLQVSNPTIGSVVSSTKVILSSSAADFTPNPSIDYYPTVRFSPDSVPGVSTKIQTAKVISISGNEITLDRPVSVTDAYYAIKGQITLDRMNFDILEEFQASGLLRRKTTGDGAIEFQPSASISLSSVTATTFTGSLSGNATSAGSLQTSRTLWGQSFNGSANVTGNLSDVGNIVMGTQANKATLTYTTNTARTYTIPDAGANADFVMSAGSQTIGGAKALSSALTVTPTSNQLVLGTARTVTLTAPTPATASRTHTIPDVGGDAYFVMTVGDQTIGGTKTFSSTISGSISGNATNVTGVVAIANGGTGQTSANAALNALLPSQTSNANKLLVTNGTDGGWSQITDAYIASSAAISDSKLATISTAGKVANSATSATTATTANTIVLRDGYGSIAAEKYSGGIPAGQEQLSGSTGEFDLDLGSSSVGWIVTVSYSDNSSPFTTTPLRIDSRSGNLVKVKGAPNYTFEYIAIKI